MSARAVLFDFSGTLFHDAAAVTPARLVAACAERGRAVDEDEAAALCRAVVETVGSPAGEAARAGADCSPELHRAVLVELAASAVGADRLVAEAFYACATDPLAWHPYADVAGTLLALRAAGVAIAVVSNIGWDLRPAFAAARVDDLVDAYVLSCELGVEKPDPAMFLTACEQLGVVPDRALMVGDDVGKDGGAVAVGMPAYLLPRAPSSDGPRGLAPVLRLVAGTARG